MGIIPNTIFRKIRIPLLYILIWYVPVCSSGQLRFNLYFLNEKDTYTNHRQKCVQLGYDGFAVISSPELYSYAVKMTEGERASKFCGVYVGMHFRSSEGRIFWDDNTLPAGDMPWVSALQGSDGSIDKPNGFINRNGPMNMGREGTMEKLALCGNLIATENEIRGSTLRDQEPTGVGSSLRQTTAPTYSRCVALCGRHYLCRVAAFNVHSLTCMLIGVGEFTGFRSNNSFWTFHRQGY